MKSRYSFHLSAICSHLFACLCPFLLFFNADGQADLYTVSANTLSVTSSPGLFVAGSIINSGSVTVSTTGLIEVKRGFTNNKSGLIIGGTLFLSGGTNSYASPIKQIITGSAPFSVNNLQTDNTLDFSVNNDITITGSHKFTNGILYTTNPDISTRKYVHYSGGNYTVQADKKNVDGWVKYTGTGNFTFPLGDTLGSGGSTTNKLRMPTLSAITGGGPGGVLPVFAARYHQSNPTSTGTSRPQIFAPPNSTYPQTLTTLNISEYWEFEQIIVAGGSSSSGKITLLYGGTVPANGLYNPAQIEPVHWNGFVWENVGSSARSNTSLISGGTITTGSLTSFSPYAVADQSNFVLPIGFTDFNAEKINRNNARLTWSVTNAANLDHFDIEYSTNGIDFSRLATVHTTLNQTNYRYIHYGLTSPFNYYRIKATEKGNQSGYTAVRLITLNGNKTEITVYPNPVISNQQVIINFINMPASKYLIQLYTVGGKLIAGSTETLSTNDVRYLNRSGAWAPGTYVLKISNFDKTFNRSIKILFQ